MQGESTQLLQPAGIPGPARSKSGEEGRDRGVMDDPSTGAGSRARRRGDNEAVNGAGAVPPVRAQSEASLGASRVLWGRRG